MTIFVGNLGYEVTETEVKEAFAEYEVVVIPELIRDRSTGEPRGFAFVEMSNGDEAMNIVLPCRARRDDLRRSSDGRLSTCGSG